MTWRPAFTTAWFDRLCIGGDAGRGSLHGDMAWPSMMTWHDLSWGSDVDWLLTASSLDVGGNAGRVTLLP